MLVILFISVFEYIYFCFNSVFLSIYHIHSFDHIGKLVYSYLHEEVYMLPPDGYTKAKYVVYVAFFMA